MTSQSDVFLVLGIIDVSTSIVFDYLGEWSVEVPPYKIEVNLSHQCNRHSL